MIQICWIFGSLELPEPQSYEIGPQVGAEDDGQSVENHQEWQEAEDQEPEPNEDVDFLIHCNQNLSYNNRLIIIIFFDGLEVLWVLIAVEYCLYNK